MAKRYRMPVVKRRFDLPWRRIIKIGLLVLVLALVFVPYLFCRRTAQPPGFCQQSAPVPVTAGDLRLLVDSTATDTNTQQRVIRQQIFDALLAMIRDAQSFVYVDFFLWNSWQGSIPETHRPLASELAEALLQKKAAQPGIAILAMTDPINRSYCCAEEAFYTRLATNGIPVVFTDLDRLPDSNLVYAGPARFWGWIAHHVPGLRGWLGRPRRPNVFGADLPKMSWDQVGALLQFKANHRKVAITDTAGGQLKLLVTSFNPADGSSAHNNLGLEITGPLAHAALTSELACVEWSAQPSWHVLEAAPGDWSRAVADIRAAADKAVPPAATNAPAAATATAEWLTEGAIRAAAQGLIDRAASGDLIRLAMFYLSDENLVRSLKEAAESGATVRIILDANRNAFGRTKNGIPNRVVAADLVKFARDAGVNLEVRWAVTVQEQFHPKAVSVSNPQTGKCELLLGSANWTRRNLHNLNMEADVLVTGEPGIVSQYNEYFDGLWGNRDGLQRTCAYDELGAGGAGFWKRFLYRLQENWGAGTF